jgi:hypothetical protein
MRIPVSSSLVTTIRWPARPGDDGRTWLAMPCQVTASSPSVRSRCSFRDSLVSFSILGIRFSSVLRCTNSAAVAAGAADGGVDFGVGRR